MAAPNLKEIEWAIHELKNKESSEENYALLAAFCVCRDELMGKSDQRPQISEYSRSASPISASEPLDIYGDSDFLQSVKGKDPSDAWAVMDKLMDTLRLSFPRAYSRVMREIQEL